MIQGGAILLTLIGIILSVLSLLFRQKENYNTPPRKIWTYWDNGPGKESRPLPKAVKLCMDSWRKFNPDYEIILLTKKNYQGYVTIPDEIRKHPHFNDSAQRFSDLVRLYALEEHGGIWLDASVLIKQPFDEWLFPKYAEFAGYYMPSLTSDPKYPMIESWFLAANKGSKFIKLWKQEFLEMATFKDIQGYIDSRKKMGIQFDKLRSAHYLAIYVAALKVLQIDKYPQDTLILRDSDAGPYKYLADADWWPEKGVKLACSNPKYQTPVMKMRSDERNILEAGLSGDLSIDKCGWLD
jgi:hypothetical protein